MRKSGLFVVLGCATVVALPAVAGAASGGTGAPGAPSVSSVGCRSQPEAPCAPGRALARGGSFEVRGRGLKFVSRLVFKGGPGRSDDVALRPTRAEDQAVTALVPAAARSGPLVIVDRHGNQATVRVSIRRAPRLPELDIAPGSRFFFGGRRQPTFTFQVSRALTARVELVSEQTQQTVRSWDVPASPGQPNSVSWDGLDAAGVSQPGSYRFRLAGQGAAAAGEQKFFFAEHLFPIRGRHNLGYGKGNGFGGGRGHQGQDMFAPCGTRLAAARGGKVRFAGYQSRAGYYVVIDGAQTGTDYAYLHMRRPPLVQTGQQVFTGQQIGEVGESGRASGCHLHFEMWSAPGWYRGGRAIDPLPALRQWDSYS